MAVAEYAAKSCIIYINVQYLINMLTGLYDC